MSKLTTNQIANSMMLMTMVSSPGASESKVMDRILGAIESKRKPEDTPDTPLYDVRVTINGVAVEFRDFAAEVNKQLDQLVAEAAAELVRTRLDPALFEAADRIRESAERLADATGREVARVLGCEYQGNDR